MKQSQLLLMVKENDYYFEDPSADTFTQTPVPYRRASPNPVTRSTLTELFASRARAS